MGMRHRKYYFLFHYVCRTGGPYTKASDDVLLLFKKINTVLPFCGGKSSLHDKMKKFVETNIAFIFFCRMVSAGGDCIFIYFLLSSFVVVLRCPFEAGMWDLFLWFRALALE